MISFILWALVLLILGLTSYPILYLLFPHLSDRGYGLARPAGLLLFGYLYWILVSFQILPNNWTGVATSLLLVLLLGGLAANKVGWSLLRDWFSENKRLVLIIESVFFGLFAFFAIMRAAGPDIIGTEKPMELAFINSILHSQTFPPADPWLSGYAISYYYFGYVIVAGLIRLTGTIPGVGFNLAIASWFAMAGTGSFSLVLNILARLNIPGKTKSLQEPLLKKAGWALLGPLLLIFMANWEGLLELLHSLGVFWNQTGQNWQSSFWKWLDIQELTIPPSLPLGWLPDRPGGIWWWRASRVLQDYDLAGNSKEIIDEFPFFSLYLADLHPHILALPFVLLACSLALELFLQARSGVNYRTGWYESLKSWVTGVKPIEMIEGVKFSSLQFWAATLLFGGLSFLNTWDFPIYVGLGTAAIVLGRYLSEGWGKQRIIEFLECGLSFGIAGVVLYIPFYAGFSSQAGGLLPSLAFFTRGAHFWVMFGVLLIPILVGLFVVYRSEKKNFEFGSGFSKSLMVVFGFWAAMLLLGLFFAVIPGILGAINPRLETMFSSAAGQFFSLQGSASFRDILLDSTLNRIGAPGGWLTLIVLLTLVWGGLLRQRNNTEELEQSANLEIPEKIDSITPDVFPFVLLLIAVGIGLVLFPEFFYLRDQFGWRMNTIFKFYYQTWVLWSVAAAVCSYLLWNGLKGSLKWIGRTLLLLSMAAGLLYPFFGLYFRFNNQNLSTLTLDGNAYLSASNPDEVAAINFLRSAPDGILAEAIGGSYSSFARISTQTGLATVLGWPGHESQWRGGAREIGSRESDINLLYRTNSWQEALGILQKYQIRYIYIGGMEHSSYRVNETKFQAYLMPAYQNNSVVIYDVPAQLLSSQSIK